MASAARTANRVVTVTQSEIENTEDKKYMDELQRGSEEVGRSEYGCGLYCGCGYG